VRCSTLHDLRAMALTLNSTDASPNTCLLGCAPSQLLAKLCRPHDFGRTPLLALLNTELRMLNCSYDERNSPYLHTSTDTTFSCNNGERKRMYANRRTQEFL
jgi:hypothetical protein